MRISFDPGRIASEPRSSGLVLTPTEDVSR
jgi:hypothetical protein